MVMSGVCCGGMQGRHRPRFKMVIMTKWRFTLVPSPGFRSRKANHRPGERYRHNLTAQVTERVCERRFKRQGVIASTAKDRV